MTSSTSSHNPLRFTLRVSKRVKRMRMVITEAGLEVVVPSNVSKAKAREFVDANEDWAIANLLKVCHHVPRENDPEELLVSPLRPQHECPREFNLRGLNQVYTIHYNKAHMLPQQTRIVGEVNTASREINIFTSTPEAPYEPTLAPLFRKWLHAKAKYHLPELVNQLANEVRLLPPKSVRIAFQRTVWGSRSSSGCLSLNAYILFLPPELMRHVIYHELTHMVHMNHSPEFKQLLAHFSPSAEANERALKNATSYIPAWLRIYSK